MRLYNFPHKDMLKKLEDAEIRLEQVKHQLIAARMKLKLKEEENLEIGKERDMFKTQTAQLAQERFQLEVGYSSIKHKVLFCHSDL